MIDLIKRIFKKRGVDRTIYFAIFVLTMTGIVMIGSASVGNAAKYGTAYAMKNMVKQGVFVALGYGAMIFFARTFKSRYITENRVWLYYFACLALMFVCLLWGDNKGAYSWIYLPGGFTIQPMEFMKIIMILFLAYEFGQLPEECVIPTAISKDKRNRMMNRKIIYCAVIPIIAILIAFGVGAVVQNDTGSAIVLGIICLFIFFCTPVRYYSKLKLVAIVSVVLAFIVILISFNTIFKAHQVARFDIWLNPINKNNYYGNGFQFANGLIAFASGGLFGKGFGASTQKFGYIPEAGNDFISAIIVEELGVVGFFVLVIIPYCIIIFKLFNYGQKIRETKSKLILYGIACYFFAHLLINVGGVSGLIPMTGVPLLLISSGGSSTLAAMISIGLAQGIIAKYNKEKLKEQL